MSLEFGKYSKLANKFVEHFPGFFFKYMCALNQGKPEKIPVLDSFHVSRYFF